MQVKKFEAPSIQEALDNVKRELGPEAIILQTKRNKRGFGLLSKSSIEVTAAISDRSLQKKNKVEARLPAASRALVQGLPPERQADLINKYAEKAKARVQDQKRIAQTLETAPKSVKITATRYIDILDQATPSVKRSSASAQALQAPQSPRVNQEYEFESMVEPTAAGTRQSLSALEEELRILKNVIEELRHSAELAAAHTSFQNLPGLMSPELQEAFEHLTLHGMNRNYAYLLLKKVAFDLETYVSGIQGMHGAQVKNATREKIFDLLASEIMQSVEIQEMFSEDATVETQLFTRPRLISLVGPSGMGKTTTLAKIASNASSHGKMRVGLLNLDCQKVGGFEQLATYAKILKIPFRSAATLEDFNAAARDFQNLDVIFVDTGGFSQKDAASIQNTQEILQSASNLSVYLLLAANTREVELYEAVNRFSVLRPIGLIMSKLDETTLYGSIYNVSKKIKLPLVYFTTGQRVPEDLEVSSKERVVSLLMDI
jgi:flagellar biosynthesis protein FlhF